MSSSTYFAAVAVVCGAYQGCQMVYFQTKNPNLGKFGRVLQWKMLVYFMAIWYILRSFGIVCGVLVYIFPVLVSCTKKNLATLARTYSNFFLFLV
jgi:hypothetical protein